MLILAETIRNWAQTDRRTDGRSDEQRIGRSDGRTDGRTVERSDGRTDGRANGRARGRACVLLHVNSMLLRASYMFCFGNYMILHAITCNLRANYI